MSSVAIKFERISKQYRLGTIGTGTLSHDLRRWWTVNILGKEDPYSIIGSFNDLSKKVNDDYIMALRDIDLEVMRGEVLGIIGKNGAGKSTLLKILSRVTTPSTGIIKAKGRVASLLEVGTGFHPEMTGRENIFMNGSIMGMTKLEIKRKFDEIVVFSGVERYIDTPVKRYSSGMTVRLGFAIAAHLEPEILVVDEVLAVGDAEFQKKAIGKMQDVSNSEGRTVLFVSHNLTAVKNLCKNGILLEKGSIKTSGPIADVVGSYLAEGTISGTINNYWSRENAIGLEKIKVKSAYVQYKGDYLTVNDPFDIVTEFWNFEDGFNINVSMHLYDKNGTIVFICISENKPLLKGLYKVVFHVPGKFMNNGNYYVSNMFVSQGTMYFFHERAHSFEIIENRNISYWHGEWSGAVRPTFFKNEFYFVNNI
jgi:lipopolysaccharide transport system ATP-binding protein